MCDVEQNFWNSDNNLSLIIKMLFFRNTEIIIEQTKMTKLNFWSVLTILLEITSINLVGSASVSLIDTAILVEEGDQFQLRIKLEGAITSTVYVIVTVSIHNLSTQINKIWTFLALILHKSTIYVSLGEYRISFYNRIL